MQTQPAQPVGKELPLLRGPKRTRSRTRTACGDWSAPRRSPPPHERNAGASHQCDHESDVLEDEVPPRRCSDLLQPSWRFPPAKRAYGVQQMQRPSPKQREQGATDSGLSPKGQCGSNGVLAKRDTRPHGQQRGANRPVAKAKSTRHGSRRGRAPNSTSAIVCAKSAIGFPAGKEDKSTRGAKTEAPQKKQPREAALERTRPPPGERLLQKSGRESLNARTPL